MKEVKFISLSHEERRAALKALMVGQRALAEDPDMNYESVVILMIPREHSPHGYCVITSQGNSYSQSAVMMHAAHRLMNDEFEHIGPYTKVLK